MEATLSLNHHLYSHPLSQNNTPISINPCLAFSSLHRHNGASLSRGFHLHALRAGRPPPRQHLVIKSMAEDHCDTGMLERSPSTRSLTLASLRSGKVVLEGMLDMKKALRDPKFLDNAEIEFLNLLKEENIDFPKLQRVVWKLEMSGKEDEAVRILKEIYDKEVNNKELKGDDAPDAYELGLLLVELMIYQGNYKPAKRICTTLVNEKPLGDVRPLLYLIIANVLLGDITEAGKKWDEFIEVQKFEGRDAAPAKNRKIDESAITFEQFKKHIDVLEEEIALG